MGIADTQAAAEDSDRQEDKHRNFAHLYGDASEQEAILNDPSHPYNVYENAMQEERAALDQATYEQLRRDAEQWIKHKRRLAESEDKPKDIEARTLRSAGDQAARKVGGVPGVKQATGAAGVFEQTLDQLDVATDNPDAIAGAVMSPVFQDALKRNMERYWGGVAKKVVVEAGKGAALGSVTRWGDKNILQKLLK